MIIVDQTLYLFLGVLLFSLATFVCVVLLTKAFTRRNDDYVKGIILTPVKPVIIKHVKPENKTQKFRGGEYIIDPKAIRGNTIIWQQGISIPLQQQNTTTDNIIKKLIPIFDPTHVKTMLSSEILRRIAQSKIVQTSLILIVGAVIVVAIIGIINLGILNTTNEKIDIMARELNQTRTIVDRLSERLEPVIKP